MKLALTLALTLTSFLCDAQTDQWYNLSSAAPLMETTNQKIIRTDEKGNVVWSKEISEITKDECGVYIIASETKIRNGKIISNPSDYDYWIVNKDLVEDDSIYVWPTLCTDYTTIFIGGSYEDEVFLDLIDQQGKLMRLKRLSLGENKVFFSDLTSGIYYLLMSFGLAEEHQKTIKIVIAK